MKYQPERGARIGPGQVRLVRIVEHPGQMADALPRRCDDLGELLWIPAEQGDHLPGVEAARQMPIGQLRPRAEEEPPKPIAKTCRPPAATSDGRRTLLTVLPGLRATGVVANVAGLTAGVSVSTVTAVATWVYRLSIVAPVVIALLNSYAGLADAAMGFVLMNKIQIITGSLDGTSGFLLSLLMCRAMNRSAMNVLFGAFGKIEADTKGPADEAKGTVRSITAEELATLFDDARSVIVVPGYGMAVAQAQHKLRELHDILTRRGIDVSFAIHPVAGRMPGHMNVLLAEADVPYDRLIEMDEINPEFPRTDVVLVVGANDVVNPAARLDIGQARWTPPRLPYRRGGHGRFVVAAVRRRGRPRGGR